MRFIILSLTLLFATPAWADWYIVRAPDGTALGHVNKFLDSPLTAPKGQKKWYTPATVIDPPVNEKTQVRTGPVYDVDAKTITWTVRDKTAQEIAADKDTQAEKVLSEFTREALVDMILDVEKRLSVLE